jgi:SAM-dependent methyltransferase
MPSVIVKLRDSVQSDSLLRTFWKCARYPFKKLAERAVTSWHRRLLRKSTPAEIFANIYEKNVWHDSESVSGAGSTLRYTENLRKHLPEVFSSLSIKSVYDAPCGDFNWMREVVSGNDILYFGGDIVPALIEENAQHNQDGRIKFRVADITVDKFPKVDLWICRDCLFHLSNKDIYLALKNYVSSEVPYVLTTTHINDTGFKNVDIPTGDFRLIDLFSAPFFLCGEVKFRISDWVDPHPPREMCLWTKEQVSRVLPKMKAALKL